MIPELQAEIALLKKEHESLRIALQAAIMVMNEEAKNDDAVRSGKLLLSSIPSRL